MNIGMANRWPCEHCGTTNPASNVFCQRCGEPVSPYRDDPEGQAVRATTEPEGAG